jgi:hypothetical protein
MAQGKENALGIGILKMSGADMYNSLKYWLCVESRLIRAMELKVYIF